MFSWSSLKATSSTAKNEEITTEKDSRSAPLSYANAVDEQSIPVEGVMVPVCQFALTGVCQVENCDKWHGSMWGKNYLYFVFRTYNVHCHSRYMSLL